MTDIVGFKKGGGGGYTPTEADDSARSISYAKVLDILSEGDCEGLVNGMQSVFYNGTPLQNPDGSINFPGTTFDFRSGTQDQDYIAGFPDVENEMGVSVELRSDQPYVRAVTNLDLSAVRIRLSTPQWQRVDASNGSITGYRADYLIELATDGGAYQTALTSAFDFKVSNKYERSHRVNLPPARNGWTLRVRRLTANANSASISDTMNIESVTEIIDAKLRYPNTALAGTQIDASQFQSVPTRSFRMRGRRVRVPANYDPATRTYSGPWDGTLKIAYTNNPAWIFYDLATHPRYGMGHRITGAQVNRYALYPIAQYCDELVPDGKGGTEPRFTCNVYLQKRDDAYKVLQDLATVFRGIAYWAAGSIEAVADMPTDPVYTFTAGNVIGGKFVRQGTDRKTRYTVALVSWNDPANHFQSAVEAVEDRDGKLRYGVRQTEITAIGCTSQGMAQRVGKMALLTSRMETQEVAFSVGLDGVRALPGQIVRIADSSLAGRPISGRIAAVSGRTITVDRDPVVSVGDSLIVNLPTGSSEVRVVSGVAGRKVTVSADWTVDPVTESVWAVESATLAIPTYRVVLIAEQSDDDSINFAVTVAQHEPGKFDSVDFNTRIDTRPVTVIPPSVQPPPTGVRISTYTRVDQGVAITVMVIDWTAAPTTVQYEVAWRKDNGDWVTAGRTGSVSIEVSGIYAGNYTARVVALNAMNVPSIPAFSALTPLQGKTTPPPAVTFLRTTSLLFGIEVEWGFPEGATDTQRTELWYGKTTDRSSATKLGDLAYPQAAYSLVDLTAGASLFFWARLVDRSGNVGPWYPDGAGVNGQSSSDATPILQYLNGQIGRTELGKELLSSIDSAAGLAGEISDRLDQLANELGDVQTDVTRVDGIVARFNPPMAGSTSNLAGSTATKAGVWSEQSARAEADMAQAAKVDVVAAIAGSAAAAVQVESKTRATETTALAQSVQTTQASVAGVSATVQQTSQAVADVSGKVSAYYNLKVQISQGGQYYVAGMAIGIDNASGSPQSQILFQADRFALLSMANGQSYSPFVIQNGQTFINQAFIGTGWIQNAMIGDVIQSTSVGANGLPRWKLDKNGTITLNGANAGSGWLTLTDSTVQVYDGNGTLRVRLGLW
ncbi:host specificity protein J [Paraburkholderia bryophila]|uniref:Putative phage tail protein n=1 Tax=Paraburkholderia bryophila TaxID=420952 RepID=A0A7Y9W358_9BURK|nr:host specificity protein J [Paraburkholderia bryophila]NYH13421.1 putative phage tail protein [Paraburkholderia bryophila]